MKEEFRFIKIDGKEHNWYSISNLGNLIAHRKIPKFCNTLFWDADAYKIPIKFFNEYRNRNKDKKIVSALRVRIVFPEDFFSDTIYQGYNYQYCAKNTIRKSFYAHQLVMQTFRP